MSGATYQPVGSAAAAPTAAGDSLELDDRSTFDTFTTTETAERQPLTKRAIYSSHRVEARTPRLTGETDAAFKRRVTSSHLTAIAHSIGWVLAAIGIGFYTDMWNVIRYDYRVNHSFLVLGFLSMFVLMLVIAYLALWVPMTATRPITDLGAYAPTAAPVGAIAGVATFVFFTIALWPIWQWITIPIMIVFAFAACLGPNLLPF